VTEGGADVVESPPSFSGAEPIAGHLDDEGLEQALVPSAEQDAERTGGPVALGDDEVQQVGGDRGVGDGPLRPVGREVLEAHTDTLPLSTRTAPRLSTDPRPHAMVG
jgi:hypothetical protein